MRVYVDELIELDELRFVVFYEEKDELFNTCPFVRVHYNLKKQSMAAYSNCGDYKYSWESTNNEDDFLKFMSQVSEQEFLSIISKKDHIDIEKSKRTILNRILNDENIPSDKINEIIVCINSISSALWNKKQFIQALNNIDGLDESIDLSDCFIYDYSEDVKILSKVFVEAIQPKMNEYLAAR